jgi:hypothetical protein
MSITRMAQEAGIYVTRPDEFQNICIDDLERFASLVAAAERNKLAAWMIHHNLATGHGDTMEQLCDALGTEIVHRIDMEVESEREVCAKVCDSEATIEGIAQRCAAAIRARGQA